MVLALPISLVRSVTRTPRVAASAVSSPFTGTQQVQDWGGEWWEYTIDFAVHRGADGRLMSAFLAGLRGPIGTFLFSDPSIDQTIAGTPVVAGAGQTGRTLDATGWPLSQAVMSAGDFIQVGTGATTRLHQVQEDVVSDGAGAASLSIWPALRSSPTDGAALVVTSPAVLLRVVGPVPINISRPDKYQFSLTARESL